MTGKGLAERLLQRDRVLLISLIGILFLLTALYTVLGIGMPMSALKMTAMREMGGPAISQDWSLGFAVLVFLMWWVMMIAMMLPSVAPTVLLYSTLLRRGPEAQSASAISAMFLGGYLMAWGGFSVVATLAQRYLEAAGIVAATTMDLAYSVPGAVLLIVAGAFQFTPLKRACLSHCRSPARFIAEHRRPGVLGGFVMGLENGVYCLGCCWFLMALLFVGGIMNLYWIVGLAAFVALEKLAPFGHRLAQAAGAVLILWGSLTVLGTI